MKQTRILMVLPLYGGSLPIGEYCVMALKKLGHMVEVFDGPSFNNAHSALRQLKVSNEKQEQLDSAFINLLSQAVHAKVEAFRPDLVLTMAQAPLNRIILKKLQKENVSTAMWFVEDYQVFTYWRAFAPFYDFFFVIQKEPFLSLLQEAGINNAMYLPLAAEPDFHKPLALTQAQQHVYGADISFLGAGYPNRRKAFRHLVNKSFKIWGSDWEGESLLAQCLQKQGERISPAESVLIYNATKINLNLHSSVKADSLVTEGDFINPRTFELAGIGAFQLVSDRTLLPDMFVTSDAASRGEIPDVQAELATFNDMHGLQQSIDFYLAHPDIRKRMADKARTRVLIEHTYEARMQAMLNFIAARRPEWPSVRQRAEDWPEGMSDTVRMQLAEVVTRLDLPVTAPFSEVIARLRQESGVLGGVETVLLFLDEWRKQYGRRSEQ